MLLALALLGTIVSLLLAMLVDFATKPLLTAMTITLAQLILVLLVLMVLLV